MFFLVSLIGNALHPFNNNNNKESPIMLKSKLVNFKNKNKT